MDDGGAIPTASEALQKWRAAEQAFADAKADEHQRLTTAPAARAALVAHREYLDAAHRAKARSP